VHASPAVASADNTAEKQRGRPFEPGRKSVQAQNYLERFLDRMRRNSKVAKSGYLRRCHSVDLHQLHLIPGDRRIWHRLRSPS
jgi:hypothetical protein